MNKAYSYQSKYDAYESNCSVVNISREEENVSALDALGDMISRISSKNVIAVIRAIIATICFFGFIGVIGGVEAETLSIGNGIIISLFLVFIEILCFCRKKKSE